MIKTVQKFGLGLIISSGFCVFASMPVSAAAVISVSDAVQLTGEVASDGAGNDLTSVGDINSDGYDDLIIMASGSDTTGTDAGAAYLWYGQAEAEPSVGLATADAKFTGEHAGDKLQDVTALGDINADGYADFLLGAYAEDTGGTNAGAAYLFYGAATSYTGTIDVSTAAAKFTGEVASDYAAYQSASAGDINGDGYSDFLIGAPYNDEYDITAGATYVFYGQAIVFSGTISLASADAILTGRSSGDAAGSELSGVGDINGDGYADFLIGAHANYGSAARVYLLYGSATALSGVVNLSSANASFYDNSYDLRTGTGGYFSLNKVGDLNADGYDDMAIAAYHNSGSTGTLYLMYGSAVNFSGTYYMSLADASFSGTISSDAVGRGLAGYTAKDMNNDGYNDLVIGASDEDSAGTNAGAVYVIYGSGTRYSGSYTVTSADVQYTGQAVGDNAGTSVSAADINGDDVMDLMIGATGNDTTASNAGAAYIVYGQTDLDTTAPADVTGLTVRKDIWAMTITLGWTNPTDSDFDHVRIDRTDPAGVTTTLTTTATGTSYVDAVPAYSTDYVYTFYAVDTAGNTSAGVTSSRRLKSPTPKNFVITRGDSTITATWDASSASADTVDGYYLYYGTSADALTNMIDVGNVTSNTITSLTNGTKYYVAVSTYSVDGQESPLSRIRGIRPKAE